MKLKQYVYILFIVVLVSGLSFFACGLIANMRWIYETSADAIIQEYTGYDFT